MRIIGIDPGTAKMGYSVLDIGEGNFPKIIETSVITTPPSAEMHRRLELIYNELMDVVDKHTPDIMVVEKLFFNTNVKTAITVGQARGIVMLIAANHDMRLFEYTALQAKLSLTGYGRSDKKEMQEAVKVSLGLAEIIKSDDANDALAIALCFIKKDLEDLLSGKLEINKIKELEKKKIKAKKKMEAKKIKST